MPGTKGAARDLQVLERIGDHVSSTTKGVKPISGTILSGRAAQAVGIAIGGFQLKRVRSGVETLLAANRISREIRGHDHAQTRFVDGGTRWVPAASHVGVHEGIAALFQDARHAAARSVNAPMTSTYWARPTHH